MVITERARVNVRPEQLIQLLETYRYPMWLDSAKSSRANRYSILAAAPLLYVQASETSCQVIDACGVVHEQVESAQGVFARLVNDYAREYQASLPFHSGWLGFLSYDFSHELEQLPKTTLDDLQTPIMGMGLYDGVFIYDHIDDVLWISALGLGAESAQERVAYWQAQLVNANFVATQIAYEENNICVNDDVTQVEYEEAFNTLKAYIEAGDLYQMNLTHRLNMEVHESPLALYQRLRHLNPAPFAAYLRFADTHVVCSSPERFLKVENGVISTRPIKGTRKRGSTDAEDAALKQELWESEKDRAELLMIIDLQRNDLARISKPGSVKVPELYTIETYPSVFHLVSTITAELREDVTPIDVLAATFPGGSITGAPKIRAMEVIDELEVHRRGIYTGSIGYIDCNGNMDFNIVIRTMICQNQQAYFHVGGGIVWDSTVDFEYEETFQKAAALIAAIRQKNELS